MNFDKQKYLAKKYHVDDIAGALIPSTSLSNVLNELETSKISNMSLKFLEKKQYITLMNFALGRIVFDEYESLAKNEKSKRIRDAERIRLEEEERKQKSQNELKTRYELERKTARERQRKLEQDPVYIKKQKLNKLKEKYSLNFYIEKCDYGKLMSILEQIDNGTRVSPEDIIWLSLERDTSYSYYYTNELKIAYHRNEASFYIKEYEIKKDPWLAVNASSHYRKSNEPTKAISILSKINLENINSNKLKSAICTTHGGAQRDIMQWSSAIQFAQTAHSYTPDNFRPCTLLGAIYMETSHYDLGQEWYKKAIERGFSEKSVDAEIKSIYNKSDKSNKDSLRNYLLKLDPHRYSWLNNKYK